jgi:hypothetical protein
MLRWAMMLGLVAGTAMAEAPPCPAPDLSAGLGVLAGTWQMTMGPGSEMEENGLGREIPELDRAMRVELLTRPDGLMLVHPVDGAGALRLAAQADGRNTGVPVYDLGIRLIDPGAPDLPQDCAPDDLPRLVSENRASATLDLFILSTDLLAGNLTERLSRTIRVQLVTLRRTGGG